MGIRGNRKCAIMSTSKAKTFLIITFDCRHSNDLFLNFLKILKNKNATVKKASGIYSTAKHCTKRVNSLSKSG